MLKTFARPLSGAALAFALAFSVAAAPAFAQTYPTRPITLVVSFAPGGLSDIPARILAAELQQRIGQSVVVENRTGASGVVGATSVLRAEPDGYTLLVNALADTQNLHYINVPYSAVNDFQMIGKIADGPPLVLMVPNATPYKNVAEIVADAKANPKKVSFASSGPATSPAIAITQLNALAGTEIVDVPYRGSGAAAQSLLSGEVQGSFVFMSTARQYHDDKRARAIAVAQPKRFAAWPELPTMAEQGFPGFDHGGFVGLAAPAKTPKEVVAYLNKHLNEALASPELRKRFEALGMTVPVAAENTPENFKTYMAAETARQGELAKLTKEQQKPN
jgi:tripartite-type tricarboxylate transporter receptor subunit TctC